MNIRAILACFILLPTGILSSETDTQYEDTSKTMTIPLNQQIIFICAHGLFDSGKQFQHYKTAFSIEIIPFNFADVLSIPPFVRPQYTSFGQESEIEELFRIYSVVVNYFDAKNLPIPKIILLGISRGASAIFNTLCTKHMPYVSGAILESPYDSIEQVLDLTLPKNRMLHGVLRRTFYKIFSAYKPSGVHPIELAHQFPFSVPLLFVSSKADTRVPSSSTEALYAAVKLNKHPALFHVQFAQGRHGKILKKNTSAYKNALTLFLEVVRKNYVAGEERSSIKENFLQ